MFRALFVMFVMFASVAPCHAQHRACLSGGCRVGVGYGSFGYGATFVSPFAVAVPYVPTVAVSVPVLTSIPAPQVVASPVVSAPIVGTFPVAVSAPLYASTGYCSGFTSVPFVFGNTRVFRHHR